MGPCREASPHPAPLAGTLWKAGLATTTFKAPQPSHDRGQVPSVAHEALTTCFLLPLTPHLSLPRLSVGPLVLCPEHPAFPDLFAPLVLAL